MLIRPDQFGQKRDHDIIVKASHAALEIKADESEPGVVKGYGSVFGETDSYNEIVVKGAFKDSLRDIRASKKPLKMLWQHDSGTPIGRWDVFKEDGHGLYLEGLINLETQRGQEAWSDVKFGALDGLSIGYREIEADAWGQEGPRHLRKLSLREVSIVTFPALKEAQLDAVKAAVAHGQVPSLRQFEIFIRDELNLSFKDAKEIASLGYREWLGRDGRAAVDGDETESSEIGKAMAELRRISRSWEEEKETDQ